MRRAEGRRGDLARAGSIRREAFLISLAWLALVGIGLGFSGTRERAIIALIATALAGVTFGLLERLERTRWRQPTQDLIRLALDLRQRRRCQPVALARTPELNELARAIHELARGAPAGTGSTRPAMTAPDSARTYGEPSTPVPGSAMTYSGLFDAPPRQKATGKFDPNVSAEYSMIDLVNRLDPVRFRWLESSEAEQVFLGWTISELKQMSFIDIVAADDRGRARETFAHALERGEALGLVVRIQTCNGKERTVEVNVGARYSADGNVSHLRCHLTDVTEKVRAERELKLRSLELTQMNEQLRRINRELEDLKNRYTDLYEAAPAMYFSVDLQSRIIECNQTMVLALNKPREQIVGRSYLELLPEDHHERAQARFEEFLRNGSIQIESRWRKSDGEVIHVWVVGTVLRDAKGSIIHARCVAQDVTAKHLLEAELEDKNSSLARANHELSERNRQLDEFVHVVSHDLQEPLRTLIAFSEFLVHDYGDRLEGDGREFVRHLVDASQRMRAMIQGLLRLARAGKVIGEFANVDLHELIAVVKTDLSERIRARNAELRINGPLPILWGDRDRLAQMLVNLIGNGIKYNQSPQPWVEVGEAPIDDDGAAAIGRDQAKTKDVVIYFKDNGIGIERQFHGTVFHLFRRLHTREEYEGTGIGLAMCAKIIQAHGGRIWLESEPGKGTTFFVRLRRGTPSLTEKIQLTPPAEPLEQAATSGDSMDESHRV
jgi:PAS domain S-box-containing protein